MPSRYDPEMLPDHVEEMDWVGAQIRAPALQRMGALGIDWPAEVWWDAGACYGRLTRGELVLETEWRRSPAWWNHSAQVILNAVAGVLVTLHGLYADADEEGCTPRSSRSGARRRWCSSPAGPATDSRVAKRSQRFTCANGGRSPLSALPKQLPSDGSVCCSAGEAAQQVRLFGSIDVHPFQHCAPQPIPIPRLR